ncbi:hypothetical protein [Vibrio rotiferianus]|uniref:hypothetical protein n=1 Tax=Vibrio rotiferianus TaxID=190895 RepID=UPI002896297B|nr:hypothetical protein THOE12_10168 [Vibrio rotiferianus]
MNNIITLKNNPSGTSVIYHQIKGRLLAVSGSDSFVFEPKGQSKSHLISSHQIQQDLGTKLVIDVPTNPTANDPELTIEQRIELDRRHAYIDRVKALRPQGGCGGKDFRTAVIEYVQKQLDDPNPPSPATLHRWYNKSNTHQQGLFATLPNAKRKRGSYFAGIVKDFALACIDDFYLCLSRPTVQFAYDCFVEEFREHVCKATKLPSYATFANWIKELPPIDVIRLREGKRAAKAASRNRHCPLLTEHVLQRVEADAVSLGIPLYDDDGGYLGTATVFVVLDCHTRSVMGFRLQVGKGEPASSVVDSYAHAMLEKDPQSQWDDIASDWPMHGQFGAMVTDGGPGYTALETQSFLLSAGVDIQLAETGCGWKKPFIERFFSTLRVQFAQFMPGYVGRRKDQRELDAPIHKMACLTPNELEHLLTKWIVDEYHHASHRGINGETPYNAWKKESYKIIEPDNKEALAEYCANHTFRKIAGDVCQLGIQVHGIFYNDLESRIKNIGLSRRLRGEETTVKVYYNTNDVSFVQVLDDETGERIYCSAVDNRVEEGMSLTEFKIKHPNNTYTNKGFGHSRTLRNHVTIATARSTLLDNLKAATKKSPRGFDEEKILNAIENQPFTPNTIESVEAPASVDSNAPSSIDLSSVEAAKDAE